MGSYRESKEKFPHGLKNLSDAVHSAGLKFGLWIDPGNVDAARVESGEIPSDWLAMIDGKTLGATHPSLAPTKQLCLGDPKAVAWIEKQLGDMIEKWHLDWIKWDPSTTVSYECNRTDHGHGKTDGAYAAYRGRMEILRYLLERFPNLSGFECDPSLQFARTNPGPQSLLPGGYTNEFITGPMVSPGVWGSLAAAGKGDAGGEYLTGRWYSASALDYYFRKHFTHGVTFGNINGMSSQFLSAAPPGFVEALERNLLFFKQYRHLLLEDVYHPKIEAAGWSSIQYVKEDATESVVYIFRDKSEIAETKIRLRGLEANAKYRVTSLNDRPERDKVMTGEALMNGITTHLPDDWLAKGDGAISEFAEQQKYGSDILLLRRVP
jgi:alpha-galactosidase